MVTFVSLFLGLITSSHPVEVAPNSAVAAVELLLDGSSVGVIEGEPWVFTTDFGAGLSPHELVAVAYDAEEQELGRARQWVNLPRSRAEIALAVDPAPGGGQVARVIWQSLEGEGPSELSLTFDGEPLAMDGPSRFPLPAFDPAQVHILSAEARFGDGLSLRAELAMGGLFGAAVATEMTAVPLARSRGRKALAPADLQGALRKDGEPLRVVATEQGAAEIVVVLDESAAWGLGALGLRVDRSLPAERSQAPRLAPRDRMRFVGTRATRLADRDVPFDLFPISQPYGAAQGAMDFLLTHVALPAPGGKSRISDAVAAAGVQAAAGNRPRAVVLVVGDGYDDEASRFDAATVRAYLQQLRVPLFVWSTGKGLAHRVSEDRLPLSTPTAWGAARDISSITRFSGALDELRRRLEAQLVAWVEGSHLPQTIEVAQGIRGIELAR